MFRLRGRSRKVRSTGCSFTGQQGALLPGVGNEFNGIEVCNGTNGVFNQLHEGTPVQRGPASWVCVQRLRQWKAVVRGGYGVFWKHTNGNEASTNRLERTAPLVQTATKYASASSSFTYTTSGGGITGG